ncbi:MAG: type 4 prepilin-like proteins leader peptide-processing enzyme [Gammaproteobacteria bacterium]|nr:MAG: type 4 prepilin-like proteins leader peptide-processing enzyme [Gammaproteobacteria bacterium]
MDALPPPLLWTAAVLLGLVVGSFLNVVVHRLPRMLERRWRADCAALQGAPAAAEPPYNLVVPRSACPHCHTPIPAHHNVPLLSYLLLRGRCAACGARISLRYPMVELLAAGIAVWSLARWGVSAPALAAAVLGWCLLALSCIDIDRQLLPDDLTLPLLWLGLLVNSRGLFADPVDAIYGAAAGYLVLWSVFWLFKLATGKEGMGYGDFKLLAALGAWTGWQGLPTIVLLASFLGALIGLAWMVLAGRSRHQPIPFGPFLALAGYLQLMHGETLARAYRLFTAV